MMKQMFSRAAVQSALVLMAGIFSAQMVSAADMAPDAMVQKVSGETLAAIKTDKAILSGDATRIIALVDSKVMPHVNFERMAGTAVGPAWRTATPEQKKRLENEFKTLLARTYAGAFKLATDKEIKVLPMRDAPTGNDVLVKTLLIGSGEPVNLDYRLEKTAGKGLGWKAYNLAINNIWMIQNYKQQFANEIKAGGIEGLIEKLAAQNRNNQSNQNK